MGQDKGYTVLIVEDNETMRAGMARVAEKLGHQAVTVTTGEQALELFEHRGFDLVISDYKLPGISGLVLLEKLKRIAAETEVLIITAYGTIELAVDAMQKGAADFITKPFSPEELSIKISQLVQRRRERAELRRLSEENHYLREQVDGQFNFGEIVGSCRAMQEVYRTIEKVARGDSSVIIYGESGTGKELVARAIHKASPRRERPFVRVHCGALAEGVLESELFGHEKGAFTGAIKRKKGRFELADHGSIFLDEIGDIPLTTQIKLLRVLQEREFERVGGEEILRVDVRVIAATNKDLRAEIQAGRFREDLYYRLHIVPIYLPPLRERKEDIPQLTRHFLQKTSRALGMPELTIDDAAVEQLAVYHWPGNIRELENVIERAAVLCDDARIRVEDLPLLAQSRAGLVVSEQTMDLNQALEMVEKQLLERAMQKARGVKTEAAKLLKIKPGALYYKLEKYGLL